MALLAVTPEVTGSSPVLLASKMLKLLGVSEAAESHATNTPRVGSRRAESQGGPSLALALVLIIVFVIRDGRRLH
jgi:hypothetical protein